MKYPAQWQLAINITNGPIKERIEAKDRQILMFAFGYAIHNAVGWTNMKVARYLSIINRRCLRGEFDLAEKNRLELLRYFQDELEKEI